MRSIVLVWLVILLGGCGAPERIPPAALADVPLQAELGLPIVEVRVDDSGPLTFLLDTGFDVSILDAATATRLGMTPTEVTSEAQPGGAVEMGALPPVVLHIGDLDVPDVTLTTVPLEGLAMYLGRPFHGIVGHDVLERYVVDIDYPAERMRWVAAADWHAPDDSESIPVTVRAGEPLVPATLVASDGREIEGTFKIDTGSIDVVGLNLSFVRDNAVVGADDRELSVGGVAVGGNTEGRLFRPAAFVIGSRRHEHPMVGYTTDSGGFEVREDAGTIGTAVLARSRLVLDYPHDRIWFVGPESPPRPENRTGLLLVSPGPDFTDLMVASVTPESPAEAAGLAAGDVLVALEERRDLTLQEARALQTKDGTLAVVYRRGGEERKIVLKRRVLLPDQEGR